MKELFIIALAFILLDVVSGVIAAAVKKEISSSVMREGLYHKMAEIVLMGVGAVSQYAISFSEFAGVIPDAVFQSVIVYVAAMELVSILENINKANPDLKLNVLLAMFGKQEETED